MDENSPAMRGNFYGWKNVFDITFVFKKMSSINDININKTKTKNSTVLSMSFQIYVEYFKYG